MNSRIDFTQLGGFPVTQYTLKVLQDSFRNLFMGLASFVGDKVVVSGMQEVGGQVTNGWLSIAGEFVPFTGGMLGADVVIEETSESRLFFEGQNKVVYFKKTARFGSGPASIPYTDIKRIGTIKDLWYGMAPKGALMFYEGLTTDLPQGWAIHEMSKGRVLVGYKAGDPDFGTYGKDGGTGGEKRHTLSVQELPNIVINGTQGNSFTGGGSAGNYGVVGRGDNSRNSYQIANFGGGLSHNVLNPYYVAAIIKKVA